MKQNNGHENGKRRARRDVKKTPKKRTAPKARKTVTKNAVTHVAKTKKKKSFFNSATVTVIVLILVLIGILAYVFSCAMPGRDEDTNPFETQTGFLASFKTAGVDLFYPNCSVSTFFKSATSPVSLEGIVRNEHSYNILVVGKDRVGLNTDVMMVLNFNSATQKINLLQIPRDTYVEDPLNRGGNKRINAIYAYWLSNNRRNYETEDEAYHAGIQYLESTVESTFGITIDKYCMIDLNGFVNIIDAIGGVPMNVPSNMYYVDEEQGLYINIKKGEQTLSGKDAEGFVRFRSGYAMGDLGRVDAQKLFLAALMEKLTSSDWYSLDKLTEIAGLVTENCTTNLSLRDIVGYLRLIDFGTLSADSITFYTAAGEGFTGGGGASLYSLYVKENLEIVNKAFNVWNIDVEESHIALIERVKSGWWNPDTSGMSVADVKNNQPNVWTPKPSTPPTDTPIQVDKPVESDEPIETDEPIEADNPVKNDEPIENDDPVENDEPIEPEEPYVPVSSSSNLELPEDTYIEEITEENINE